MLNDIEDIKCEKKKNEPVFTNKQLKKMVENDIQKLRDEELKGPVAFLTYCSSNYANWKGQKVNFSTKEMEEENLKLTCKRAVFHYHLDRQM